MIGASVAAVALALIPPPVSIFYSPDFPERTKHHMRDTRPVNRCSVKTCIHVGHWPPGGKCPMHQGSIAAVIATPELIAEIDARYDR
jgi:hypothetical protein